MARFSNGRKIVAIAPSLTTITLSLTAVEASITPLLECRVYWLQSSRTRKPIGNHYCKELTVIAILHNTKLFKIHRQIFLKRFRVLNSTKMTPQMADFKMIQYSLLQSSNQETQMHNPLRRIGISQRAVTLERRKSYYIHNNNISPTIVSLLHQQLHQNIIFTATVASFIRYPY